MKQGQLMAYRCAAAALVNYACNGGKGRDESDEIYKDVTEGRDIGKQQASYSSCGDLGHWLLYRLGVRESWVNRKEHGSYRIGRNVSNLCWSPCPSMAPLPAQRFDAGDILVVYNRDDSRDAHVLVALEHRDGVLLSGDYGQPGGALRTRELRDGKVGGRKIRHVLTLPMALSGALEQPDWALLERLLTGEEFEALKGGEGGNT